MKKSDPANFSFTFTESGDSYDILIQGPSEPPQFSFKSKSSCKQDVASVLAEFQRHLGLIQTLMKIRSDEIARIDLQS